MTPHDRAYERLEAFLSQALSLCESESMDRFMELDLSMSRVKAIYALVQAGEPIPIHALADRLRLSVAAAGRTVDQLVQGGLAERQENPADRRVKLVTVTEAGVAAVDAHVEAKRDAMRSALAVLSEAEADRLGDALQPLLAPDPARPIDQETPA